MKASLAIRVFLESKVSPAVAPSCRRFFRRPFSQVLRRSLVLGVIGAIATTAATASVADDQKAVAALDTQYQAAVKNKNK